MCVLSPAGLWGSGWRLGGGSQRGTRVPAWTPALEAQVSMTTSAPKWPVAGPAGRTLSSMAWLPLRCPRSVPEQAPESSGVQTYVQSKAAGRMSSPGPWSVSIPENGFHAADSHLRGYVHCATCGWCSLKKKLFVYKLSLTPEVKKSGKGGVVDFIAF